MQRAAPLSARDTKEAELLKVITQSVTVTDQRLEQPGAEANATYADAGPKCAGSKLRLQSEMTQ